MVDENVLPDFVSARIEDLCATQPYFCPICIYIYIYIYYSERIKRHDVRPFEDRKNVFFELAAFHRAADLMAFDMSQASWCFQAPSEVSA